MLRQAQGPNQQVRKTWCPRSLASRVLNRPQAPVPHHLRPLMRRPLLKRLLESKKRTVRIKTVSPPLNFGRFMIRVRCEEQLQPCRKELTAVLTAERVKVRARKVGERVMVSVTGKETWRPRSLASRVMDRPQARVPRRPIPAAEGRNIGVKAEAVDDRPRDRMTAVVNTPVGQEVQFVLCGTSTARALT